jgi:hypothetical protein
MSGLAHCCRLAVTHIGPGRLGDRGNLSEVWGVALPAQSDADLCNHGGVGRRKRYGLHSGRSTIDPKYLGPLPIVHFNAVRNLLQARSMRTTKDVVFTLGLRR